MRFRTLAYAGAIVCVGCHNDLPPASEQLLEHGDTYEVLSVHSTVHHQGVVAGPFHGCVVDKRVAVTAMGQRRKLATEIERHLIDFGPDTGCMWRPHYGIHVTGHGHTFDAIICFHCFQCEVFQDGQRGPRLYPDTALKPILDSMLK